MSPSAPATSSSSAGRRRLPPALMMYSEIWLISSDLGRQALPDDAVDLLHVFGDRSEQACSVGGWVAVDDMVAELGSAAIIRRIAAVPMSQTAGSASVQRRRRRRRRARTWRCDGRSMSFDRVAKLSV